MRFWRCIEVNEGNRKYFTINKIYESDDRGFNIVTDTGYVLTATTVDRNFSGVTSIISSLVKFIELKPIDETKAKDYNIWIDSNNNPHNITNMTEKYIIHCINMINRSLTIIDTGNKFTLDWTLEHGLKYIEVFTKELMRRMVENIERKKTNES